MARNFSSASAALSLLEDVALLVGRERDGDAFDLLLDPALLVGLLDVHVLDADGAAVGVAQEVQDVAEGMAVAPADAVGEELAVEVPDGEAVGGRVELGVHARLLGRQRVEVGDEVAPHPVHVDQRSTRICFSSIACSWSTGLTSRRHSTASYGHADRAEDVVVEARRRPAAARGRA